MDIVVNFERLSDDNIYAQLRRIKEMAGEGAEEAESQRVGILTAAERDTWAKNRMQLMEGRPALIFIMNSFQKVILQSFIVS